MKDFFDWLIKFSKKKEQERKCDGEYFETQGIFLNKDDEVEFELSRCAEMSMSVISEITEQCLKMGITYSVGTDEICTTYGDVASYWIRIIFSKIK